MQPKVLRLQFEGGVVVISHDSQLLSVVCDDAERSEVWLVEDGKVEKYDGYFQDYKDELMKEISDEMDEEEVYQRPDAIPTQWHTLENLSYRRNICSGSLEHGSW